MKKIFFGILAVVFASGISYAADVQQQDASVGLSVPQIIELVGVDMSENITPGPEDYARDLMVQRVVNDNGQQWGQQLIALRSVSPQSNIMEWRVYTVLGHERDAAVVTVYNLTNSNYTSIETKWRARGPNGNYDHIWDHLKANGIVVANPTAFPADRSVTSAGLAWMQQHYNDPNMQPIGDSWDNPIHEPIQITGISNNTGNEAAVDNAMYDANDDIGKGFAERTAALELTIFTNAQDGAALFVHGLQPAAQQGILRLEDTYVSVCKEKTYILCNAIEGAFADASSMVVMENKSQTLGNITGLTNNSSTQMVIDNPREGYEDTMGNPIMNDPSDDVPNKHQVDYNIESKPTWKAYSTWLRIHNQAQHLFEVKMSTKAPRLVVVNLGIANLARYTEGEYTNTLTFTLMPIVG